MNRRPDHSHGFSPVNKMQDRGTKTFDFPIGWGELRQASRGYRQFLLDFGHPLCAATSLGITLVAGKTRLQAREHPEVTPIAGHSGDPPPGGDALFRFSDRALYRHGRRRESAER